MTADDYLSGPEDVRRRELVWGVVREPPSPFVPHQRTTTRIAALLDAHVRLHDLGTVLAAPMDVVLDKDRALIVQPDVMFISHERAGIIRDFIWGAPDLVVEVASRGSLSYDSRTKLDWYARYGVREYWLVDPEDRAVTLCDLTARGLPPVFQATDPLRSAVLPAFAHTAAELLADQL
jgi:Uma2 family endonuclease